MADIVERLTWLSSRHAEHMNDGPRLTDFCHAGREAASVITALRAEVERLATERDHAVEVMNVHGGRYWEGRYRDEAAENARLREALEEVLWYTNQLEMQAYDRDEWPKVHDTVAKARAALAQEKKDE